MRTVGVKTSKNPRKPKQLALLKNEKSAYGGDLRNTRDGRSRSRPISTRETMHLVLRSSQATGDWSFRRTKNDKNVRRIVEKFSVAYGVRVISMANVGNHLHLQLKLANRFTYKPFIRAVTGAIAMAVTGRTRWSKTMQRGSAADCVRVGSERKPKKFWDYRPFTRVVTSLRAYLKLTDYIRINQLEGEGYKRNDARFMIEVAKNFLRER